MLLTPASNVVVRDWDNKIGEAVFVAPSVPEHKLAFDFVCLLVCLVT